MTAASAMTVNRNWGIPLVDGKTHFELALRYLSDQFGDGVRQGQTRTFSDSDPRHYLPTGECEVGYHEGRVGVILLSMLPSAEVLGQEWFRSRQRQLRSDFPESHSWVVSNRQRFFYPLCTAGDDGLVVLPSNRSELKAVILDLDARVSGLAVRESSLGVSPELLDPTALSRVITWSGLGIEFCI